MRVRVRMPMRVRVLVLVVMVVTMLMGVVMVVGVFVVMMMVVVVSMRLRMRGTVIMAVCVTHNGAVWPHVGVLTLDPHVSVSTSAGLTHHEPPSIARVALRPQ
jgi:hypothetical protein